MKEWRKMYYVLAAALVVGGATMFGSLLGYTFKRISRRFRSSILSFAAGIMLSAAIVGLIIPALEMGGILPAVVGIFSGALFITFADLAFILLRGKLTVSHSLSSLSVKESGTILFILAMAVHNFPEGLAAGFSFGTGNIRSAMLISGSIALQNIPEGMITVVPMLSIGIHPKKALQIGLLTGAIEIIGTLIGFFSISFVSAVLPYALTFAGGTMLYVICSEMIPENGSGKIETYCILLGFCLMLISDYMVL